MSLKCLSAASVEAMDASVFISSSICWISSHVFDTWGLLDWTLEPMGSSLSWSPGGQISVQTQKGIWHEGAIETFKIYIVCSTCDCPALACLLWFRWIRYCTHTNVVVRLTLHTAVPRVYDSFNLLQLLSNSEFKNNNCLTAQNEVYKYVYMLCDVCSTVHSPLELFWPPAPTCKPLFQLLLIQFPLLYPDLWVEH